MFINIYYIYYIYEMEKNNNLIHLKNKNRILNKNECYFN